MTSGLYHIAENGPSLCRADSNKPEARGCPYANDGHYESIREAEEIFASKMGGAFRVLKSSKIITLSSNIGEAEVIDGDLSNPQARALLSSGLCGDLALAIHEKTGATPYFLSYTVNNSKDLQAAFEDNPDSIIFGTNHVLVASPTKPNHFLDAYGVNDAETIEENWDGAYIVEGTPEMLKHFADKESSDRLSNFAAAAIELDKLGESYSLDEDMLDIDYSDEDDEDYWED